MNAIDYDAVTEAEEPALCACGRGYTGHYDPSEHQGWTNHATWAAALWLGNDEPLYRAAMRATERHARLGRPADKLGAVLHAVYTADAPEMARQEVTRAGGMYHVNWTEIADGWAE